ncbi:MAG: ribonuclease HI family protein [candidate division WOR-3 bacterium]
MASYQIEIDGSARNNPGPAGIGVRIIGPDGTVVKQISRSIGIRTNNQAEYEAFICALQEALKLPDGPVVIRTDSELLYRQITGRYRVRHPGIRPLYETAQKLMNNRSEIIIELVPREANRATDRLARAASGQNRSDSSGPEV